MSTWGRSILEIVAALGSPAAAVLSAYVAAKVRENSEHLRRFHDRWSSNGD